MSEEITILEPKPPTIQFHFEGKPKGTIAVNDKGQLTFHGDLNYTAEQLFERVKERWEEYMEAQE